MSSDILSQDFRKKISGDFLTQIQTNKQTNRRLTDRDYYFIYLKLDLYQYDVLKCGCVCEGECVGVSVCYLMKRQQSDSVRLKSSVATLYQIYSQVSPAGHPILIVGLDIETPPPRDPKVASSHANIDENFSNYFLKRIVSCKVIMQGKLFQRCTYPFTAV